MKQCKICSRDLEPIYAEHPPTDEEEFELSEDKQARIEEARKRDEAFVNFISYEIGVEIEIRDSPFCWQCVQQLVYNLFSKPAPHEYVYPRLAKTLRVRP